MWCDRPKVNAFRQNYGLPSCCYFFSEPIASKDAFLEKGKRRFCIAGEYLGVFLLLGIASLKDLLVVAITRLMDLMAIVHGIRW